MKVDFKIVVVAAIAVAAGALVSYFMMRDKQDKDSGKSEKPVVRHVAVSKKSPRVKKVTEISLETKNGKNAVRIIESEVVKPKLNVEGIDGADDNGEESLTELQKSVIRELQNALDDNDLKAVRKAISKFTVAGAKTRGGRGARVPKSMRMSAVQALGWFGKEAVLDLLEFMADIDEDVSSEAYDQFELALQDCTMGDFERSEILKAALSAINDRDRIDTLLCSLNDMRPSRKCETIKAIFQSGTESAKAVMSEQLGFYTEPDVTPETIDKWAAMNPDAEGDDDLYGGARSEDNSRK